MSKKINKTVQRKERKTPVRGSMGLEASLFHNQRKQRYDAAGKSVLSYKEVLAIILRYSVQEYADYSIEEIINFIDTDSISGDTVLRPDADTRIHGDNIEQSSVNEATVTFDSFFRVQHPENRVFHIHFDVELQGNYYPGYPLEMRGIYHLARMLSRQLEVVNRHVNYGNLEKVYSIFICVGNVPRYLWNTMSYYEFENTENIGDFVPKKENYDLMKLVIIRIGKKITEKTVDIIRFLHGIFYDSMEEVSHYINFSQNEELRKDVKNMSLNGDHLIEYGRELEKENTEKERQKRKESEQKRKEAECRVKELEAQLEALRKNMGK